MKMARSQLKALVKECLVEILKEGLGNTTEQATTTMPTRQAPITPRRPAFDPMLDRPVRSQSPALKEAIKHEAAGNPIMEAIFADTAKTTLPAMLAGGDTGANRSSPAIAQQEQFVGTPEQVFGEDTTSRWANLAFASAPVKKTA